MTVCDVTATDTTKSYGGAGYGTGWSHVSHIFKKVGAEWKFSGGASAPYSEDFNIEKSCGCSTESAVQKVRFDITVTNGGVVFGRNGADTWVQYDVNPDTSDC
jgi:hypothetical protein